MNAKKKDANGDKEPKHPVLTADQRRELAFDEDVISKLESPKTKGNAADEVRVTTTIIRRRAKVVQAEPVEPVAEAPAVQEAAKVEKPVVAEPPVAAEEKPVETAAKPEVEAEAVAVEKPAAQPAEPAKPGPNQARILGRMEIPGVTNRPTRVVSKDAPATQAQRPAASRPATATRPGEARPSSARPGETPQRRPAPAGGASEPDRSRMKQVQMAPAALPVGDSVEVAHTPCVLALDGERERVLRAGERVSIRLSAEGPYVVDIPAALQQAARTGFFVQSE